MKIQVNGQVIEIKENTSLLELLRQYEITEKTEGVAVAVDELVIFKNLWATTNLQDGQKIEIVWARQGG